MHRIPFLPDYKIILASNSPRRKELLKGLNVDFEVRIIPGIDESYPNHIAVTDIAGYIASKKADAYIPEITDREMLITADTIVVCGENLLEKPSGYDDAVRMLKQLSGRTHQVITGVCIYTKLKTIRFSTTSEVTFAILTDEEIEYYVDNYKPYDKAGAYGIQEWIGYIGVESIQGSFYNVMGLPIQRLYRELKRF